MIVQQEGNITISDCHSINNTITSDSNSVSGIGFIAGSLQSNQRTGFILVSDCSTKFSNFISRVQHPTNNVGGNFGYVGMNFLLPFFINNSLIFIFFPKTDSLSLSSIKMRNLESIGNNFQILGDASNIGGNIGYSRAQLENLISFNNTINGK